MKMTDLRAKARAIFGPAIAEPMPKQPNGAKALQQRANARPIPTYKDGGAIKKPVLTPAEKRMGDALMMTKKGKEVMAYQDRMQAEKDKAGDAKRKRADALLGISAKKDGGMMYKHGGKVQTSSDTARKLATEMGGMKKGGKAKDGLAVMIAIGKAKPEKKAMGGSMKAKLSNRIAQAKADMDRMAATKTVDPTNMPAGRGGMLGKAMANPKMRDAMDKAAAGLSVAAASMPSRGGGMMNKVMSNPKMRADLETAAAKAGVPVKKAVGGAGKVRKGQAPIKKAQGGAAKVRKGMMTPEGNIINVMNKMRGK